MLLSSNFAPPFFFSLLFLGLLFITLINVVGPIIKANDVGFSAIPFTVFVATLLLYVAT